MITKAEAAEKYIRNPPSKSSKITAVPDTSWQYKGVGKGGSLGTPVDAISQSTDKYRQGRGAMGSPRFHHLSQHIPKEI